MVKNVLISMFLIVLSGCGTLFKKAELVLMEGDLCSITIPNQHYEYDVGFLGEKTYSYDDGSQLTITRIKKENGNYDFRIKYLSFDSTKKLPNTSQYTKVSQVIDNNSYLQIDYYNSKVEKHTVISGVFKTLYDDQTFHFYEERVTKFDMEIPYKYTTALGASKTIQSYVIIDIPPPYFLIQQGGTLCINGKPYKKVYK